MALHTAVVVAFSGEKPEFHSADDPPIATWNWFYFSSVALTHSCMMAMITLLRVWVSPRRRLTAAPAPLSRGGAGTHPHPSPSPSPPPEQG